MRAGFGLIQVSQSDLTSLATQAERSYSLATVFWTGSEVEGRWWRLQNRGDAAVKPRLHPLWDRSPFEVAEAIWSLPIPPSVAQASVAELLDQSAVSDSSHNTASAEEDPGVCYQWSKGFGACKALDEHCEGVDVCLADNPRPHLCHFCRGPHKGKDCSNEEAKEAFKEFRREGRALKLRKTGDFRAMYSGEWAWANEKGAGKKGGEGGGKKGTHESGGDPWQKEGLPQGQEVIHLLKEGLRAQGWKPPEPGTPSTLAAKIDSTVAEAWYAKMAAEGYAGYKPGNKGTEYASMRVGAEYAGKGSEAASSWDSGGGAFPQGYWGGGKGEAASSWDAAGDGQRGGGGGRGRGGRGRGRGQGGYTNYAKDLQAATYNSLQDVAEPLGLKAPVERKDGDYKLQQHLGKGVLAHQGGVPCRVCGWGMAREKLTKVKNATRLPDYKAEADYGSCGQAECTRELQGRVDLEATYQALHNVKEFAENSRAIRIKNSKEEGKPTEPYHVFFFEIHTTLEALRLILQEAEYDTAWEGN